MKSGLQWRPAPPPCNDKVGSITSIIIPDRSGRTPESNTSKGLRRIKDWMPAGDMLRLAGLTKNVCF
jgi:hypothetical protein